jgi:hypothetical protein
MKIFISWSGETSEKAALALRDWIKVPLPFAEPWVSSEDIAKGAMWGHKLAEELEGTHCGIVCITPGNVSSPWLNFEAGALSKVVDSAQVHPFLLGMKRTDLSGPLAQFQATEYSQAEVKKMLLSINKLAGARGVQDDHVERTLRYSWVGLQEHLEPLAKQPATSKDSTPIGDNENEGDLSDPELITVLKTVANSETGSINVNEVSYGLKIHLQRAQYLLETLAKKRFLKYHPGVYASTIDRWTLTSQGRVEAVRLGII